ncbi:MAG: hypothetical protein Ct9H300mP20_14370 [Gammaproteobacteria bacterium]|nr:MAG: hypothetical protein Ct9H300mP20_14370 [Gammaproteobacteria bacterium]
MVDSFIKWRVKDVAKYFTTTGGDEERAKRLLSQRVDTGLRNEFGVRTVKEVVSGERDQLMNSLTSMLDEIAQDELGVQVIDLRVKRIDLPLEVSESVYNRMRTERQRLARGLRAQGNEVAEKIRALPIRIKRSFWRMLIGWPKKLKEMEMPRLLPLTLQPLLKIQNFTISPGA